MKQRLLLLLLTLAACIAEKEEPLPRPDISQLGQLKQEKIALASKELEALLKNGRRNSDLTRAYGNLGRLYHAYKVEETAAFYYGKARELEPENYLWPYLTGKALKAITRIDEGHDLIESAHQLNPQFPPILVELGEYSRKRNEIEKASALFSQALKIDSQCVAAMAGLARIALTEKDVQAADTLLKKALMLQPQSSELHFLAGTVARELGNLDLAEDHFQKRSELKLRIFLEDPAMEPIRQLAYEGADHFRKGQEAMARAQYREARNHFEKAVSFDPNIPEYQTGLGFACIKTGDPENALIAYLKVVKDRPADSDIHYNIAGLLMEMGRDSDAAPHFDRAFELDPENTRARLFAVDLHRVAGNFEKALAYYKDMAVQQPEDPEGPLGRALMLIRLHRYPEARRYLEEDLKTFPNQPAFHQALARVLAASPESAVRDGALAEKHATLLLNQSEDSALAETYAMAQAELGRYDLAEEWQQKAISLARQEGAGSIDPAMVEALESYKQSKPRRKPWPDNAPLFLVKSYGRR